MQKKHYYLWVRSPHPQEYFRIELGRKKQLFILIRCVKIHTHTHTHTHQVVGSVTPRGWRPGYESVP